jgi:type IV pilus assembly protein PilM
MAIAKGVWGIDIGQCALKALRLEMIDGKPTATAFDYVEHTKILSQPDADPDALIKEALEKFLSRNTVKLDEVAIGIAGQSGLARFVKLPPVEEKKIAEIVKFEAKQQIPFPLDEVVWDYQKISGGDAVDGFALETEIGLFAMKRDIISRYLGYFTSSKIEVHTIQMSPLALVNFATYEILKKGGTVPVEPDPVNEADDDAPKGKKRCAVVMDVGTEASNLIITDGAKIIWQRPIPLGGNNFTRALTKELKLTFAKAEHLKRNAAKSPEMANILRAIKPVLTDFVGEVQRSLGYFTNTHRDAHVAYMIGLGSAFKLPGLQKYLGDKLSLEVRKPGKLARLSGDNVLADPLFQENMLTFPVAYGLALQALGQARLTTNLLPAEIQRDRVIRAKKPYGVAAAAMLLVGTAGLAWGFGEDLKSVNDKRIADAEAKVKSALGAFSSRETAVKGKVDESQDAQRATKTIIAGQEERLNWPRFFEVQTAAMPKPGDLKEGGNLTDFNWKGGSDAGVDALRWFNTRMRDGVPIDRAVEDDRSAHPKNLAMANIEAVHTRWVNDPAAFLAAADAAVYGDPAKGTGTGEKIAEFMKDDEKEMDATLNRVKPVWKGEAGQGAWVVEIRGYTDYKDGQLFLQKALLRNLQKFDSFAKEPGKVGEFIVGVQDPVKGRVSHAFIYSYGWKVDDAQPNSFVFINQSQLDGLLGGGGGPGGFGKLGSMGMPQGSSGPGQPDPSSGTAPTGPIAPAWTGLTSSSLNGASSAGGAGPGGAGPPSLGGSAVGALGTAPGTPSSGSSGKKETGEERRRWEFTVMLIWREPIPSGSGTPAPPEAATTGISSGMSGANMPGPGMPGNK